MPNRIVGMRVRQHIISNMHIYAVAGFFGAQLRGGDK